eukprot:CAMPEP_0206469736 /NCGR_PEP_ID=MMETSP0324_2-20121206/30472_1 /ASSEMBLY_ACC=CAM_ASM_000836 /TAXON_ID=2866 /ORGANISM="Crypthecodinium cohnii, Strain Seligo" /LENGTH=366 /DNA_ID=CAMNT_0053943581 /DNA_START=74 /DNA_END=1174 /DNA_ORIENTATION=+
MAGGNHKPTDAGEDEGAMGMFLRGGIYGGGIIVMLGLYGVIQERIMSEPYGDEFFKVSVFMVLCNRLVAIGFAFTMMKTKGEDPTLKAPLWKYVAISFSNVAATWCQYEALKYVSFPVQMLGKSFKMMPVMMWGILISGKKYALKDWLIAAGVTGGVTMFLLTGETKAKHADKGSSVYGLLLLLMFLGCDGFTSTFQEKLFKDHDKASKFNQMFYVNSCSAGVSAFTLIVSGKLGTALSFCTRHSDFVAHAGSLSVAAVAGQFFIYSLVKEFGALVLAATMNIRQVISILNSYIMYSHPITFFQILALVAVFASLFYKTHDGWKNKKAKAPAPKPEAATTVGKEETPEDELELAALKGSQDTGNRN